MVVCRLGILPVGHFVIGRFVGWAFCRLGILSGGRFVGWQKVWVTSSLFSLPVSSGAGHNQSIIKG